MKIFVSDPIGQSGLEYLKKCGYAVSYEPTISATDLLAKISTYDVLIVRSRTRVTQTLLEHASNLKIIARSGAGVDTIDVASAIKRNIVVVNAPGSNAEAVAEHTMALMLALARDIVQTSNTLSGGIWSKATYRGMELKGKTLGVVGFGSIGKRVAELAHAFGMNILECNRSATISLERILSQSDIITLHVPLNAETSGMIGDKEFALMKPISYLINTSRGAIVDEAALINALSKGLLAGAALDVFETEPLSRTSLLCSMNNVILTPHVAANSKESEERASIMIADDIDRVLQGKPAIRRVTL